MFKGTENCLRQISVSVLMLSLVLTTIQPVRLVAQQTPPPSISKLSPELELLTNDLNRVVTRSGGGQAAVGNFSERQLKSLFGISDSARVRAITVSIQVAKPQKQDFLERFGGSIITTFKDRVIASIPVSAIRAVSNLADVVAITALMSNTVPSPVKNNNFSVRPVTREATNPESITSFPTGGLTGKGVIVGIIDSGIDWRHPDFIKPDGTSRIVALWDLADDSFDRSRGRVGTKPPLDGPNKLPLGTLYTQKQINSALTSNGVVNSRDLHGHGTAVAGIAAGNGRGSPSGLDLKGLAPVAELLVVRASHCAGFDPMATFTAEWMVAEAKKLGRPIVINMSFGSLWSARDGMTEGELFLDSLLNYGEARGVAITVSAGNDGRENLHAVSSFGADGQPDEVGEPVELVVRDNAHLFALFSSEDSWRLHIVFLSAPAYEDERPRSIVLFKSSSTGKLDLEFGAGEDDPELKSQLLKTFSIKSEEKTDRILTALNAGRFLLIPEGGPGVVKSGKVSFYSLNADGSTLFGAGVSKEGIIGSPGNASSVITVGSYIGRNRWRNAEGSETVMNLSLGSISPFTSAGFRRDGIVKPEISAPGQMMISPLSSDASSSSGCNDSMATTDRRNYVFGGDYLAWEGTSASSPYTAGVIALMLEKNPTLSSGQIKKILIDSARLGPAIGPVPNSIWGWGALDGAKAIAMTPVSPNSNKR